MSGFTDTLEFATGVIILPQRQTAVFAKQAATLDVLSGGRLRLGVGLGWNEVEYVALDQDFKKRGKRLEEQVQVLRQLWTQPLVTLQERWHTIPDAGINPLPLQRPIPIWFGGSAKPMLERLARLADGWMPGYKRAADAKPSLEFIYTAMEKNGRARSEIGIEPRLSFADGNPDTWVKIIDEWKAAGATHLSFNTMGCGFDTPAAHLKAIKKFAKETGLASVQ